MKQNIIRVGTFVGSTSALLLLPFVALGQQAFDPNDELGGFILGVTDFINDTLVPLIFAISLVVFLWGVFQYFIAKQGDSADRSAAKDLMLYAIGGFILMVSIWGIVNLIAGGLGLNEGLETGLPEAPEGRS